MEVGEDLGGGLGVGLDDGDLVVEGPFDFAVFVAEAEEAGLGCVFGGEEVAEDSVWSCG